MDKLIKLLNEYERERQGLPKDFEDYTIWDIEGNGIVQSSCDPDSREYFKYYIISKDYQFIEWLVDNDKIDQDNKFLVSANVENQKSGMGYVHTFDQYESLLMLLSIQDEPLTFLISILK